MSQDEKRRRSILGIALMSIVILSVSGYALNAVSGYRDWQRNYDLAKGVVDDTNIGDTRNQVETSMLDALALHYHCDLGRIKEDVYLIGSNEPAEAVILLMVFEEQGGTDILIRQGGLDVDMLSEYTSCQQIVH